MQRALVLTLALAACDSRAPAPSPASSPSSSLALAAAALVDGDHTIPYSGYVDFDGTPVNANSVHFNFAIYPCASTTSCAALWSQAITAPVFAGRFAVELGSTGQTPLPDAVFAADNEVLFLSIQIEGKALGSLQKLVPTPRADVAARAFVAESADDFTVRNDLTIAGALLPSTLVLPSDTAATLPPATQHEGEIRYLEDERRVVFSDGTVWQPQLGTRAHPALNCAALRDAGISTTGTVFITGVADGAAWPTECNNDVDGGGWNLLVRGTLNNSRSPLSNSAHPWWDTFGAIGGPTEAVFATGYSAELPWTQLLVVKIGGTESLVLSDTVRATLFSQQHGNLTASLSTSSVVSNGAVFSKDTARGSGNGLVNRFGRWLTGACDSNECHGAHGFGVQGENHGGNWYPQATTMFQTYSYGAGSPESIAIYAR